MNNEKFDEHTNLANEASAGYFVFDTIIQEDERHVPDLKEAFRLYREAARMGHANSCARLGHCYLHGTGTDINLVKGFKWSKRASESGDPEGLAQCDHCYRSGQGVDESEMQAWRQLMERFLLKHDGNLMVTSAGSILSDRSQTRKICLFFTDCFQALLFCCLMTPN
jgi:TPR repeat protein